MLNAERRRQMWEAYTATSLWMIGKTLGRDSWNIPGYIEMVYPDKAVVDTRSAEEIRRDILARLTA